MEGIGASQGIAIGKAFVMTRNELKVKKHSITDINNEIDRLNSSVEASISQLSSLIQKLRVQDEASSIGILEAHLAILRDCELISSIKSTIEDQGVNAEYSVNAIIKSFADIFYNMEDDYMKERVADINDVGNRIISNLSGNLFDFSLLPPRSVVIAKDLLPSDIAQINKESLEGFVTELGGKTSHTAIIARTHGIPAVFGVTGITGMVRDGDLVVVDGINGEVMINPDKDTLDSYMVKKQQGISYGKRLIKSKDLPAMTVDGISVKLEANIGGIHDIEAVLENGAEGIGLFRTEFLYMDRNCFPSEDEQFEAYRDVITRMRGKKVTIRTLDIGGDKDLPYFGIKKEQNSSLGFRAIRVCLEMRDMFKTQLKAILRAGVFGNVSIMYPMIIDVSEVLDANEILEEAKNELRLKGMAFSREIEVGTMIETPAAAMQADILAEYVDFFSIGTNDLTQYALAVDKGNAKVKDYYNHFNTGVVRLIKNCIDQAHKHGKSIAMCGEMAADSDAVKLLLGLGLDVFSMSPASVPVVKDIIRSTTMEEARRIAKIYLK